MTQQPAPEEGPEALPEQPTPAAQPETPRRLPKRGEPPPLADILGRLGDLGRTALERLGEQGRTEAPGAPIRLGPSRMGARPGAGQSGSSGPFGATAAEGEGLGAAAGEGFPVESGNSAGAQGQAGQPGQFAGKPAPGTGPTAERATRSGPRRPKGLLPGLMDGLADQAQARLEQSALKAIAQAYDQRRGDLEQLAVDALKRTLREESQTLERLIERSVEIKKREVRLSLLVLVGASLLYVALGLWLG